MLRKLTRDIWYILIQWLFPCATIQRWLIRRKLTTLRKQREESAKGKSAAQLHQAMMQYYSSYRNQYKTINFLRNTPKMWSFIDLAVAHYNTQIDHSRDHSLELYIKPDFDGKLYIAQDYFIRDRCGLVEWWTRFTIDGREFFDADDKIKLDLQIPFHKVFVDKCLREFDIEANPDDINNRRYLSWPCLDIHGNPNTQLMNEVQAKVRVY